MTATKTKAPSETAKAIQQIETLELAPIHSPASAHREPLAATVDLLALASRQGTPLSLAEVKELMAMQASWDARQDGREAREALKAFTTAMAEFKSEPLEIFKTKTVDFSSAKGRTHYKHAGLDDVVSVIAPALARHGLSHRWEPRQDGNRIIVRTVVTHIGGHSESVELEGAADDSGNKNPLQQRASTIQYLSRYGVLSILGLATKDMGDDDGRKGGGTEGPTAEQEAAAAAMLDAARAESLKGHEALKAWWRSTKPDEAWWKANRGPLQDAATKADAERA